MNGVFGETAPRFYFECYIHDRLHECYIDVKEMTLTITPIEDDGETLMVDCRETFDDRFWFIEKGLKLWKIILGKRYCSLILTVF